MRGTTWITGLTLSLVLTGSAAAHPGHIEHDLPVALAAATLVGLTGIGVAIALRRARRPALSSVIAAATALAAMGIWLIAG